MGNTPGDLVCVIWTQVSPRPSAMAESTAGWSYRQAERKTGVSAGHLCRLEHGQRVPSVAVAELLIDQFHLCGPIVDQLLEVAVSDAGRSETRPETATPWSHKRTADPRTTAMSPSKGITNRCTARNRSGEQCGRTASRGTNVCAMHGAKAPQVRNKATMRLVEAEARTLLERLGEPEPLGHPVEELLAVAAECREWLGVLREMVADLGTFTTEDHAAVERAGALVEIYERALDRTARLLVDMTKLDLESRRIQLGRRAGSGDV